MSDTNRIFQNKWFHLIHTFHR